MKSLSDIERDWAGCVTKTARCLGATDWADEQEGALRLPSGGEKPATWQKVVTCANHVTKAPDGWCRVAKLIEVVIRDRADGDLWTARADILNTIAMVQQPFYRSFFAVDLLVNQKEAPRGWAIFTFTSWFCPLVLGVVSGLQLACNGHKLGMLNLKNYQQLSHISQRAGMFGAVVAALFQVQQFSYNCVTKQRYEERYRAPGVISTDEAAGLQRAMDKLSNDGWNSVLGGMKYTCDALKTYVVLYANSQGIWHLKYAAALLAVGQTAHGVWYKH